MIAILMTWLSGMEIGILIGPLWRKFTTKDNTKDYLIYGSKQARSIPILDSQIKNRTGELSWMQKRSAEKLVEYVRLGVHTQAFELGVKKLVHDKWILNKALDTDFKVL